MFSGAPTTGSGGTALAGWGDSVWLSLGAGTADVNLPIGGAGTGNTFPDALSHDTAVFGTAEQAGLYLSTDRGTHFTRQPAGS